MPTSPLSKTLQEYGTLFTNVKFIDGPTGHFNGHTSAITGKYTTSTLSLRDNPPFPTVLSYIVNITRLYMRQKMLGG